MSNTGEPTVAMDVSQEVRFAVVMYGGVSLAIYINGVAQELLHLVRATARNPEDFTTPYHPEVTGTEAVYRHIGQLLGRKGLDGGRPWTKGDPIRTRFVIDILSGTSAGGINGIYLAKALAKAQSMDDLQRLWVDKGDVATLLNDGKTLPRSLQRHPPEALLNGRYMYAELLKAFEEMDKKEPRDPNALSPYADELDLFVTTTDIRGLPLPLKLFDQVVDEKRHRNVFRFRYRDGLVEQPRNDFDQTNNGLLAFAARCTSAFPFAFEPMRAGDAVAVGDEGTHPWNDFFPMYRVPPGVDDESGKVYRWSERSFGDGGYLDNKPFSYAIDMLATRRASVPTDRKLLYVEPDPEEIDRKADGRDRPNAIENVNAALSLARYETIREDLERILDRNRLIERVDRILSGLERDVSIEEQHRTAFAREDYRRAGLRERIVADGACYGGYHRLKVGAVTDELTTVLASAGNFATESDEFKAIRGILRAWRDATYAEDPEPGKHTQNEFLFEFDLGYRLRRLTFVLGKIDRLFCLDGTSDALFERWKEPVPKTTEERTALRRELTRLCTVLAEAHRTLRRARLTLATDPAVLEAIRDTALDAPALRSVLDASADGTATVLSELLAKSNRGGALDRLAAAIAEQIAAGSKRAATMCEEALQAPGDLRDVEQGVRRIVRSYYTSFERYDLIAYPILFATGAGDELDAVEVVRVSPQDATALQKPPKLAGTSLMHFGAFLDRGWRQNDILWGRLDGAERLITVLLRGTEHETQRDALVKEAHQAILTEWAAQTNQVTLSQLMTDAIMQESGRAPGATTLTTLQRFVEATPGTTVNGGILAALTASLSPTRLYEFFKTDYRVNRDLDRRKMTETLARATSITGKLLQEIAQSERVDDRAASWLARFGTALVGLLQVAVPSHVSGDIGRRLLGLVLAFEVFVFAAGLLLTHPEVEHFGLITMAVTLAIWLASYLLRDFVVRRQGWRRLVWGGTAVAVAAVLLLASLGAAHFGADAERVTAWALNRTPRESRADFDPLLDAR
jgi:patatin-related protein